MGQSYSEQYQTPSSIERTSESQGPILMLITFFADINPEAVPTPVKNPFTILHARRYYFFSNWKQGH
jgi:hypothetical protein